MFHATLLEHSYAAHAWPAWLAAFGLALCALAAVLLPLGAPRGPRISIAALLIAPAAGLALLLPPLAAVGFGALAGSSQVPPAEAGPTPWQAFHGMLLLELGFGFAAPLLLGAGAMLRALLVRPWACASALLPLGLGLLGLLLAGFGPGHATALLGEGPLPLLEGDGPLRVHVGHAAAIAVRARGSAYAGSCRGEPQPVPTEAAGRRAVALRARCPLVLVERSLEVEVGEDRGDPAFPLAPGHTWRWRHVREWRNQFLWFFPERGRSEGPLLSLRVLERREDGPLTTWRLREEVEGGEASEHQVYAWNGSLFWVDAEGAPSEQPFFALGEPQEGVQPGEEGERLRPCDFGIFADSGCSCLTAPQGEAALPGPSLCARPHRAGDDFAALGSLLLGVLTAGLVILDPDDDARWVLVSSSAEVSP